MPNTLLSINSVAKTLYQCWAINGLQYTEQSSVLTILTHQTSEVMCVECGTAGEAPVRVCVCVCVCVCVNDM